MDGLASCALHFLLTLVLSDGLYFSGLYVYISQVRG
jgi:hypothetical protein